MLYSKQPNTRWGRTLKRYTTWGTLCLCYGVGAYAGQVNLAWDANTQSTLGGYKLYYGTTSGSYSANIDIGNKTSYTVPNLTDGTQYFFAVKAYDTAKATESGFSNEVSSVVGGVPVAAFSASPASGTAVAGQVVTFTDKSTGNITSRSWDFGNGQTGSGQTASTNYNSAGTYTVKLTATGPNGSNTSTQSYSVKAASTTAPVANFIANPTSGTAPLSVTFTDSSSGSIASWSWNFGDGATSTTQSPSHTYATVGSYTVKLTVTDSKGVTSVKSSTVNVTAGTTTATGGLVAAYAFEEMTGATALDASGLNNHGTITQAARTTAGRFGRGLSFDGVNDWVSVKDAASLDFTKAMTLEAWVNPKVAMSAWSSIIAKETATGSAYSLVANGGTNQPDVGILTNTWREIVGGTSLPANTWKHLAATYDGATLRLYIDAVQVAQAALTGTIQVSNGMLRIGGHSILGDFFNGRIDEVRLYNRALTQTEIASDRVKPIINSLWKTTATPIVKADPDRSAVELGLKFKADVAGTITGLRFYKDVSNTGTHIGSLWDNTGKLLAQATFTGETASGWQQVNFATPVKIAANTVYVASYHVTGGHYSADTNYFATAGYDVAPLHALGGSSNPNGVYVYGTTPIFPKQTFQYTNYWVDVLFKR